MPAQSPVPERQHRGLGLIETMLWTRQDGMPLLPLHLARLSRSAAALGFALASEDVRRRIEAAVADRRLDPADPLIRHKTTARHHYDAARSAARQAGADEALFLNGAGAVCEGAITSVFLRRGEVLLTPPLACG